MASKIVRRRALYVALRDEMYPRNSRMRRYLQDSLDMDVDVLPLTRTGGYLRHCIELLVGGLKSGKRYDVVIIAEFSLTFAWVAWVLAKRYRAVFVVDFFVGLVETLVVDRAIIRKRSLRSILLGACDSFAVRFADILLADTQVRADKIVTTSRHKREVLNLPVGAPAWAQPASQTTTGTSGPLIKFLYYGNYVPLHGVPILLEAMALIPGEVQWSLTMIGRGQDLKVAVELTQTLGLGHKVTFRDSIPESELAEVILDHDVVLGIFGQSQKASSVIANKVWQGLACGKIVVTRRSPALREIESLVEPLLVQVKETSASSIASALTSLSIDALDMGNSRRDISEVLETYVQERYMQFGVVLERALNK